MPSLFLWMKRFRWIAATCLIVLIVMVPSVSEAACDEPFIQGADFCLATKTYGAETAGDSPTLVVFLHGDMSRGGAAHYLYERAEEMGGIPGVVGVGLIRPGYYDNGGNTSDGPNKRLDHYTEENNRIVAEAIKALKQKHKAGRTIVVGHSGGAAQTGVILGRYPDLIDGSILVSCPCDIPQWRANRGKDPWPNSQSPRDFIDQVSLDIKVIAITGSNDSNTAFSLAVDYVDRLKARGIDAQFVMANGTNHGFDRQWPTVVKELRPMLFE